MVHDRRTTARETSPLRDPASWSNDPNIMRKQVTNGDRLGGEIQGVAQSGEAEISSRSRSRVDPFHLPLPPKLSAMKQRRQSPALVKDLRG